MEPWYVKSNTILDYLLLFVHEVVRGHTTISKVGSETLDVTKKAQMFSKQASTAMFVPGFMATYCHAKPLLAVLKAQKALPIIGTSENKTFEPNILI